MKTETRRITKRVAGREYSTDCEAVLNAHVGKFVFTDDALGAADVRIAAEVATKASPSAEAFSWMRRALDIKAADLAKLLGVRAETISRWETGAVDVDRSAWFNLGGLVLEAAGRPPELRVRMEHVARARKPKRKSGTRARRSA